MYQERPLNNCTQVYDNQEMPLAAINTTCKLMHVIQLASLLGANPHGLLDPFQLFRYVSWDGTFDALGPR